MPFIQTAAGACYYRMDGADEAPVLVLSHSLGLDHGMWDAQVAALASHCRVLRYDTRGHGASAVPAGDYTIDQLGRDVLALVDALGISTFAFCGVSLGGMVGQWLAAHHPARLTHLVLANTSPRLSDPSVMEARRRAVLDGGMAAVVETALARFFMPATVAANGPVVANARRTLLATNPVGYAGCCAAIRDMDQRPHLASITVPTLVIGGTQDVSMPWVDHSGVLAALIPGARVLQLPTAHLSSLERPRSFGAALASVLVPRPVDTLASGMEVRRSVLGHAHVDRSVAATTDFTRAFQELITRYAWGTLWTRPGLDHRTRRLLVLAITASLGRWEEFRLHLKAGFAHELEPCDVEEVLMQTAVYAGVPAANTGFHAADEELRAFDEASRRP
jgi:3-oxoadipate enol-lactonase / 4-carboxymuconolactone decarboxylase